MPTPLYNTDVQKIVDRTPKTALLDTDVFVVADEDGTLAPITKPNAKTTLGVDDAEDRLDTLEGADTEDGSVLKDIKDNAENATYDNTDSGLTANTLKTAIDEVDGRLDTAEGEIDDLQTAENAIKGTGWTDENLVDHEDRIAQNESDIVDLEIDVGDMQGDGWTDENLVDHEDRLDTLEGDVSTEGSVLKDIKENAEDATFTPSGTIEATDIKGAIAELDSDVQQTNSHVALLSSDVETIKKNANLNSNDVELTETDIGSVSIPANAIGRALVGMDGLTATNIVNGADIANLGTVTFASVLNHKYYDVLHGTILTGTGSDITVTNDTGATADIAVINLTATFGAGNEPSASDCAKYFSYFSGTQSIKLPMKVVSENADESESTSLYLTDAGDVRSVPAISDEVKVVNGELVKVKNVQRYVLQASDITSLATGKYAQSVTIPLTVFSGLYPQTSDLDGNVVIAGLGKTEGVSDPAQTVDGDLIFRTTTNNLNIGFPLGTYASLAEARADLAGTVIYYQLATPTETKLTTIGNLLAFPNGRVRLEPNIIEAGVYNSGYSIGNEDYPIDSIVKVTKIDSTGAETDITDSVIDGDNLGFTSASLTDGDVVVLEYAYESNGIQPDMTVGFNNNALVVEDESVAGNFYRISFVVDNGVLTPTATLI